MWNGTPRGTEITIPVLLKGITLYEIMNTVMIDDSWHTGIFLYFQHTESTYGQPYDKKPHK